MEEEKNDQGITDSYNESQVVADIPQTQEGSLKYGQHKVCRQKAVIFNEKDEYEVFQIKDLSKNYKNVPAGFTPQIAGGQDTRYLTMFGTYCYTLKTIYCVSGRHHCNTDGPICDPDLTTRAC